MPSREKEGGFLWVLIRKMSPKPLEVPSTPSAPVPLAMATWRPRCNRPLNTPDIVPTWKQFY